MPHNRANRNSSIELLRIIAYLGVIVLHYNHPALGRAFLYVESNTLNNYYLLFSETVFMCAVNITIIISGYFLAVTQKRSFVKVAELMIQLTAFRMAHYLVSVQTGGQELSFGLSLQNLLPVNYYVLLYCTLYIVSPYINIVCSRLNRENFRKLLVTMFIIFSVWTCFADFMEYFYGSYARQLSTIGLDGSQQGYTIVNFVMLYCIGAYFRLNDVKMPAKYSAPALAGTLALLYALVVWQDSFFGTVNIWNYNSPLVIIMSVLAFLLFAAFSIRSKLINELSACGFTCFLFHQYIMPYLNTKAAVAGSLPRLACHQIMCAVVIYLVCYVIYRMYKLCSDWFIRLIRPICDKVELTVAEQ